MREVSSLPVLLGYLFLRERDPLTISLDEMAAIIDLHALCFFIDDNGEKSLQISLVYLFVSPNLDCNLAHDIPDSSFLTS